MTNADMSTLVTTEQLTIIPAGKKELSHVIMLAHRIWPDVYKGILPDEHIENMLPRIYSYDNLQKEVNAGHQFHVAYIGPMPVGYASAYLEDDVIWLKKLYVDRYHQGKRLGVKLMHAAVSPLLPASEIRLLVAQPNVPAQNFYLHNGFSRIGEMTVQMGDYTVTDFLFSMSLNEKN